MWGKSGGRYDSLRFDDGASRASGCPPDAPLPLKGRIGQKPEPTHYQEIRR